MKLHLKLLIAVMFLAGPASIFGGGYYVGQRLLQYIQADPARVEGAKAFAALVGLILLGFGLLYGLFQIIGWALKYLRDVWQPKPLSFSLRRRRATN